MKLLSQITQEHNSQLNDANARARGRF